MHYNNLVILIFHIFQFIIINAIIIIIIQPSFCYTAGQRPQHRILHLSLFWSVFFRQLVHKKTSISSLHLLASLHLHLFPVLGVQSVRLVVHLLSSLLQMCPAHFNDCTVSSTVCLVVWSEVEPSYLFFCLCKLCLTYVYTSFHLSLCRSYFILYYLCECPCLCAP